MAKTVNIDYLSQEVVKQLSQWVDGLDEKIEVIAREEGKTMVANVKRDSPVRTTKDNYKSGWRMKIERKNKYIKIKGYNKNKPQITWLLENGHALPSGGRTKKIPHLYKNEEEANKRFKERVEGLF